MEFSFPLKHFTPDSPGENDSFIRYATTKKKASLAGEFYKKYNFGRRNALLHTKAKQSNTHLQMVHKFLILETHIKCWKVSVMRKKCLFITIFRNHTMGLRFHILRL